MAINPYHTNTLYSWNFLENRTSILDYNPYQLPLHFPPLKWRLALAVTDTPTGSGGRKLPASAPRSAPPAWTRSRSEAPPGWCRTPWKAVAAPPRGSCGSAGTAGEGGGNPDDSCALGLSVPHSEDPRPHEKTPEVVPLGLAIKLRLIEHFPCAKHSLPTWLH